MYGEILSDKLFDLRLIPISFVLKGLIRLTLEEDSKAKQVHSGLVQHPKFVSVMFSVHLHTIMTDCLTFFTYLRCCWLLTMFGI